MDGLTNEERALAWTSCWQPSFDGWAIINKDFTYRAVNPQFCEILGVTPAQLVGQRFQDITPPGIRKLDEANAQLVMNGVMDFYILPKVYDFGDGHTRNVIMLMTRVPKSADGSFRFFVSRIMLDVAEPMASEVKRDFMELPSIIPPPPPPLPPDPEPPGILDFLKENAVTIVTWCLAIGGTIAGIFKYLMESGK